MNKTLTWQLAWRYLRGKRSANAVPILSRISMLAIAVGAAAMIILFSVVNGFEGIVKDMYKAFYPDIKITAARGKFFSVPNDTYAKIEGADDVVYVSKVLEDIVFASGLEKQRVATIKGVDQNYFKVNTVSDYVTRGAKEVRDDTLKTAMMGQQLEKELQLDVDNIFSRVMLYYPNGNTSGLSLSPESAFNTLRLTVDGEFMVQQDFDDKYILAALEPVQELMQQKGKYTSLELKLSPGADPEDVQENLREILGDKYVVQTQFEQNRTLYTVLRSEKLAVYGILLLVLIIASFNMTGALSLLVLEKQKDMAILKAMGATDSQVKTIFITEGILWSGLGGGIGLFLGAGLCILQQYFGFIKMGEGFVIDAYPVAVHWADLLPIIVTVIFIGVMASWLPAVRARKVQAISLKSD